MRLKRASRLLQFIPAIVSTLWHIFHLTPLISCLMKYALPVHLHLGTIVIDPIAIASLRLMAPQQETAHGPETAQPPSRHFNLHRSEPLCIYFSHCQLDIGCAKDRAPCPLAPPAISNPTLLTHNLSRRLDESHLFSHVSLRSRFVDIAR